LSQLRRDYPKSWETFWSNSSIVQILQCADMTTSKHVSEYLGTGTVNAKTGGTTRKQVMWDHPLGFRDMVEAEVADAMKKGQYRGTLDGLTGEQRCREATIQRLHGLGFNKESRMIWDPDQQLAARPVLLPDEVRNSPADKSLILIPGLGNFRLKRFYYYSHPVLSARARHDPNKPAPIVKTTPPPIAAAPYVSQPLPAAPMPPPPPARPPQTVGDELAGIGKDLTKKAASAAVSFLKDKLR
jgi:type IV secretory pathway TraG/TraD family ATPase VirD4